MRHLAAKANALRYSPIFRIVKAGVGDLKSFDRSLNWRYFRCESGLANRLRIAKAGHMGGDNVFACEFRFQPLQVAECLIQELFVRPRKFDVVGRHVIGHVNYGLIAHRSKVREFDNPRNGDVRVTYVDPEMPTNRSLQFEDETANARVCD